MGSSSSEQVSHSQGDPFTPTESGDPVMRQATGLAQQLATHWRRGLCCRAEELLADHPAVLNHPRAAVRVIYEEVFQRQERGQEVDLAELSERFPQWRDQLAVVLDCHRLLGLAPRGPRFPEIGQMLGQFRLLAELGRGGMGRVYLAEQAFLAGRLMVLKLTACGNQEYLNLARLQHTHIVPLYSVRDFPDRNLRKLCMSCLGGATLQQLLRQLRTIPLERRTGLDLLEALRTGVADPRLFWMAQGPNRRFLENATYVQAVCWIGVCLADALHYAHQQGLVHLDVKPSNVLLTADCQPMLLDFHLAREPISPREPAPEWLGGTRAYMSPEQQAACRSCRNQEPITGTVDARSDVYSLGLLLREAFYGAPPAAQEKQTAPDLPPHLHLSTGLRDVLARCLQLDPAARYSSAELLAEDLRRHLTNRPLVGVRNRNIAERLRKWYHRRPQASLVALLLILCLGAVLAFGALYTMRAAQQQRRAEEALAQGQRQMDQRHYADAVQTFDRGLRRLGDGPAGDTLYAELCRLRQRAARAHNVAALHAQVERSRYLLGDEFLSAATLEALASQCRTHWEARNRLLDSQFGTLDTEAEEGLRRDLLDVAVLWSHCSVRLAAPGQAEEARREAQRVLNEAEDLFGPSPVLSRERWALAHPGDPFPGADIGPAPRTAWEHYMLGRWLLNGGDVGGAAAAFDCAVDLRPHGFWPWFGKGLCAHRQERFDQAVMAFSVCIALAPESAACYHNRALALAAYGDKAAALCDYDRALRLDSTLGAAMLNRGALQLQQQRFALAEADFRQALTLGANPAAAHYNLALLYEARQDYTAALECIEVALRHYPTHRPSHDLQARLKRP
jgi:eukaryotic-like serine/threonine-protein kinase